MPRPDRIQPPTPGAQAQPCDSCEAPLAADQRYCLNCGQRRADPRVDYAQYLQPNGEAPAASEGKRSRRERERDLTPLYALGGLFALGVMLAVGVLIGKSGNDAGNTTATPQTITVAGAQAAPSSGAANSGSATGTGFQSDWPSGTSGYTVEIETLKVAGSSPTAVDAAKAQASAKGATQVGALDSDQYPSLPAGEYVIYSGVYDSEAEATKALKPLQASFPDATVVKVSQSSGAATKPAPAGSQALKALQGATGQDNPAAGGGSGGGSVVK